MNVISKKEKKRRYYLKNFNWNIKHERVAIIKRPLQKYGVQRLKD